MAPAGGRALRRSHRAGSVVHQHCARDALESRGSLAGSPFRRTPLPPVSPRHRLRFLRRLLDAGRSDLRHARLAGEARAIGKQPERDLEAGAHPLSRGDPLLGSLGGGILVVAIRCRAQDLA